jgi:hypothetical protein
MPERYNSDSGGFLNPTDCGYLRFLMNLNTAQPDVNANFRDLIGGIS